MNEKRNYTIKKAEGNFTLDGDWSKQFWSGIESLNIDVNAGQASDKDPRTQAKIAYDQENIYVIFRVEDSHIKAVYQNYQDPVCRDSCVEFFFNPSVDPANGYFNFEINCGGTLLLYHQLERDDPNRRVVDLSDCEEVEIGHSMPKIVDPEITEPTVWTIEYAIPLRILRRYANVQNPGPGVKWLGNLYKCGDGTSHPHWITWSPMQTERPDFHRPEFFGELNFSD